MNKFLICFWFIVCSFTLSAQTNDTLHQKNGGFSISDKIQKTILKLDSILKADPHNQNALLLRAFLYKESREYHKALKDLDLLLDIAPSNLEALNRRASVKFEMGDNKGCIQDLTKVIQIEPKNEKHYFERARYEDMIPDYENAIKDYDKAIELNPRYIEAYVSRGYTKLNVASSKLNTPLTAKQAVSACKDFKKAKELGDKSVDDIITLYCE